MIHNKRSIKMQINGDNKPLMKSLPHNRLRCDLKDQRFQLGRKLSLISSDNWSASLSETDLRAERKELSGHEGPGSKLERHSVGMPEPKRAVRGSLMMWLQAPLSRTISTCRRAIGESHGAWWDPVDSRVGLSAEPLDCCRLGQVCTCRGFSVVWFWWPAVTP